MTEKNIADLIRKPIEELFYGLAKLHSLRGEKRIIASWIYKAGAALIGVFLIRFIFHFSFLYHGNYYSIFTILQHIPLGLKPVISNVVFSFVLQITVSLFLITAMESLIPIFYYCRCAAHMHKLGVEEISTSNESSFTLIRKYLQKQHKNEDIRIICISGNRLFVKHDSPLYEAAKTGKLKVVMPTSTDTNRTILERFETYSEQFKDDNNIHSVGDLVNEVIAGKMFLSKNQNNVIKEHNTLCMWRVVLLSEYCIVQAYFPNYNQADSHLAPNTYDLSVIINRIQEREKDH